MIDNLQAANAVNETEGIATPIKINLQLFAEGDPVSSSDPDPSPSNEPTNDPTPSDPTPTNDPVPTPQPSNEPTQTQAFARRLKEETQKAIDSEYDRLYGTEYGIHSKAEYDAAIARQAQEQQRQQFQEQNGFDPEAVKPLFEEWKKADPDFQELSKMKQEKIFMQQDTELKNDPNTKEFYTQWESEIKANAKAYGCDLDTAFTLKLRQSLGDITKGVATKAEQTAIQKIANNGASSPGSLSDGGDNTQTFFTREQVEKMTKEEVNKNYDNILKSTAKW